jgi:hypothetical protein
MINRIRAGFCTVPNPFNPKQISRISLLPSDVDVIVFWTRNPRPLMAYLDELDSRGFRYYFQFTILGYPRDLEPKSPSLETAIRSFKDLSKRLGPSRVVWRYDPIVFTRQTPADYHRQRFALIAGELAGHTRRSVVSIVDRYRKAEQRMQALEEKGAGFAQCDEDEFASLMRDIAGLAENSGMEVVSCAEELDLSTFGIRPGKCVDDKLVAEAFGIDVSSKKDPSQRKACGCVVSRDVGMYDTCVYGCPYCYATKSFTRAQEKLERHDPQSPSLIG